MRNMKRISFLFLSLLLMLAASAAHCENRTVYIANPVPTDRLHLRRAARKGSDSLGRFYNGTSAEVLGHENGFSHVRIGTGEGAIEGWMLDDYLSDTIVTPALPGAYVLGDRADDTVTLYTQPVPNSAAVCTYYDGMLCDILGDIGEEWVYVFHEASGTYGYLPTTQIVRLCADRPYVYDAPMASIAQPDGSNEPIHLRAQPGSGARSLGRYYPGTQVYVLDEADGWSLVYVEPCDAQSSRRYGYMRSRFLEEGVWIDSKACYAILIQDTTVLQKALPDAPQLGTLLAGARVKPYAIEGDYAHIALSEEVAGCIPLEHLAFSDAQVGNPSDRLYGAQGLAIVSMPDAAEGTRLTAYATCNAYYPLSRVNSAPAYSRGFAQGDCLILLADLGQWAQVFDGYFASFVPSSSLNILHTGDFTAMEGLIDAGEYVAGKTIPAGFYSYHLIAPGTKGLLRIEGDGYTREYKPTAPALYSFYLPEGARVTVSEGAVLSALELGYRNSPFSFGYASGRILAGANMSVDTFWVMPAEGAQESYITITTFAQDMSAKEPERIEVLPADENGWPQQYLFAPAGCFIEYVGCIFGVNG